MGANQNSREQAIQIQLDSSNYCKLAHLLRFLGIEEQSDLVVDDEIRPLLNIYAHLKWPRLGLFN